MIRFYRKSLLFTFPVVFIQIWMGPALAFAQNSSGKANIMIILVDDAGYADFGFMGCKDLETPNIDGLAASGVIFTDAHVSATVCAPSRAGIISGRYQQRFGFECNGTGPGLGLDPGKKTLADIMKSAGYRTIALGKWHLGDHNDYLPNKRGFDEFFGFRGGGRSYFPLENPSSNQALRHNARQVSFEGYLTDVLGDKAVDFIQSTKEPFFMYFAPNAVHTPMEAKKEHLEKFANHSRKELAAMMWSLDENIGKMVKALENKGILDNTLIFFLSDNGGAHNNQSSMGSLKGWKGNKFEGGHRVPFFLRWGDRLTGGVRYDGLTSSLDIFATAVVAAGITGTQNLLLDGVNLIPYLDGSKDGEPHDKLFWRKDEEAAVRIGDYKLIKLDRFGSTLYNLANDLGESVDLSTMEKRQYQLMLSEFTDWEKGLMEPLWLEGKDWTEVTYNIHLNLMRNEEVAYRSPAERLKYLQKKSR